ncbi:MAG: 2'-5' RNA ligase family protein [Actinomycetes bacterium]
MRERTIGVAIAIPEPHGSELQAQRESFGDQLATSIPTHITLLPPTPVPGADFERIEEHLRKVAEAEHPFDIHLRGTGTFHPVSPVVFVSVALGISDCERVEGAVRSGPLARELTFPYHPHVTVAHDLPQETLEQAFESLAHYDVRFPVWGFSLYEHGKDGVWRPHREFAFGQPRPTAADPADES